MRINSLGPLVFSRKAELTWAEAVTHLGAGVFPDSAFTDDFMWLTSNTAYENLSFEILEGQKIFLSPQGGNTSCQLFIDDLLPQLPADG